MIQEAHTYKAEEIILYKQIYVWKWLVKQREKHPEVGVENSLEKKKEASRKVLVHCVF